MLHPVIIIIIIIITISTTIPLLQHLVVGSHAFHLLQQLVGAGLDLVVVLTQVQVDGALHGQTQRRVDFAENVLQVLQQLLQLLFVLRVLAVVHEFCESQKQLLAHQRLPLRHCLRQHTPPLIRSSDTVVTAIVAIVVVVIVDASDQL